MSKPALPVGAALFVQSGDSTPAVNASLQGALDEARRKPKVFNRLLGAKNGVLGLLQEELFDFAKEDLKALQALTLCPGAAAGSCNYEVKAETDCPRILDVFQEHNVRYLFPMGDRAAMDLTERISRLAQETGYELLAMGIPKSATNSLTHTDHCPGFASVAKYNATMVMEAARDTEAMYATETVTVQEVTGLTSGWQAAACGLARHTEEDGPHLILIPEIPVNLNKFADLVQDCLKRIGRCVIVAAEGTIDESGRLLSEQSTDIGRDSSGLRPTGTVAEFLGCFIEREVGVRARRNKPGTLQYNGTHWASKTDLDEAGKCGQMAVRHALQGTTGFMVTLVRKSSKPYKCDTGLARISDVASSENKLPRQYMNDAGTHISHAFRDYCIPLLKGEVSLPMGKDHLPIFPRLQRKLIPRKCNEWNR